MGAKSISIDNDIIGEPDIECLDNEIRVWVKTRKDFGGDSTPTAAFMLSVV